MSYQMVDPRRYVLLPRWQLWIIGLAVFSGGLLSGGVVIFRAYRDPAINQINACQKKLDETTRLAKKAQLMAYGAIKDNVAVLSQAEHVSEETMFLSEQLFRRSKLTPKSRDMWADALQETKIEGGVGGPEPGDQFTE